MPEALEGDCEEGSQRGLSMPFMPDIGRPVRSRKRAKAITEGSMDCHIHYYENSGRAWCGVHNRDEVSCLRAENARLLAALDNNLLATEVVCSERDRALLQNEGLRKILDECRGFLSHTYCCPESPDKFSEAVVATMGRINAVLLPTEKPKCEACNPPGGMLARCDFPGGCSCACHPRNIEKPKNENAAGERCEPGLPLEPGAHVAEKRKCAVCGGDLPDSCYAKEVNDEPVR